MVVADDATIAAIAGVQHACFSRAQARDAGFSDDAIRYRLRSGRWRQVHPGAFVVGGAPDTWRCRVMAAVLAAGPRAVASHRSAARLWEIDRTGDGRLEVLAPAGRHRSLTDVTLHRTNKLLTNDCAVIDGIPVTNIERTLMDLAAVLPRWEVEHALDDVLRRGLAGIDTIARRLAVLSRRGRNGSGILAEILDARDENSTPQSRLERRGLRFLRNHAPPGWRLHHRVELAPGWFAEFDVAWPAAMVALEWEGDWHDGGQRRRQDRRRDRAAQRLGWRMVYAGPDDLRDRSRELLSTLRSLVLGARSGT